MTDASEYLLIPEVATIARVSVATVRWWLHTGRLHSVRPGRRRLIARRDLDLFLAGTETARVPGWPCDDLVTSAVPHEKPDRGSDSAGAFEPTITALSHTAPLSGEGPPRAPFSHPRSRRW